MQAEHDKEFHNEENKQMLWDLLNEMGVLNETPQHLISQVKKVFEINVQQIQNYSKASTLITKNKEFYQLMLTSVKDIMKDSHLSTSFNTSTQPGPRTQNFQNELNERTNEIDALRHPKQPNHIDFSDKSYQYSPITDMEKELSIVMKERDKDIDHNVPPPPPVAPKAGNGTTSFFENLKPMPELPMIKELDANINEPLVSETKQLVNDEIERTVLPLLNEIKTNQEKILKIIRKRK